MPIYPERNPFGHPAPMEHTPMDVPLGLGMALAQDAAAMDRFSHLSPEEKNTLVAGIQCARSGSEARETIRHAMSMLKSPEREA